MPPMRAPRLAPALFCLLASGALSVGCGSSSDSTEATAPLEAAASRPAPPASEFPSPDGRSLRQVLKATDGPAEEVVEPAAVVFYPGENRYPFGVFERQSKAKVDDAEVALYYARVPTPRPGARSESGNRGQQARAEAQALDQPAVGPFPAAIESLATKPRFRAESTAEDGEAAAVVYSTQLDFPRDGEWRLAAILKEDGELKGTLLPGVVVGEFKKVPKAGQRAPLIHTPTAQDVHGELSKITTRIPPDTQNKVDYADALGKEPIVLLFATPQFCQSRVCGPVVDVAEQAKHEFGDKAAFIHMEIYNDNDPAAKVRPQVRRFHLPTEPWLFAIDRNGVVKDAIEGAFGLKLMHEAVEKAIAP
ncbi:MAG TPA: hypothetical protein VFL77_07120 [Solirubrobacterales bacterium]|nr:hypothetical protein [Solirubrobacterales bacterium]